MGSIGDFFQTALNNILNYISRYSFFANGNYYSSLWNKYFTVAGFFLGGTAVVFIYLAGAGENKKSGFFRSLAIIALLNSMGAIYNMLCGNPVFQQGAASGISVYEMAANPISGVILALVIFSCYKGNIGNAFCFGMITYGVTLLMFNVFISVSPALIIFFVLRAIILGLVCMLLTRPKYFYSSLIVFISYYLISKIAQIFLVSAIFEGRVFSTELVFDTLNILVPDLIIFGVVLVVSIIYERAVLTVKKTTVMT